VSFFGFRNTGHKETGFLSEMEPFKTNINHHLQGIAETIKGVKP
jgi:hypothetical protein